MVKPNLFQFLYLFIYLSLFLAEFIFIILAWSPYGNINGAFQPIYSYFQKNLNQFALILVLVLLSSMFLFPGIGFFSLLVILYRVAQMCCQKDNLKENFGDGMLYGWGQYYPDYDTQYDQGCLERNRQNIQAGYASALGDNKDLDWMNAIQLSDYENKKYYNDINDNPYFLFPKENNDNWVIPKIKNGCTLNKCQMYVPNRYFAKNPCSMEGNLAYAGSILRDRVTPRGLVSTSLLAKELRER